MKYALISPKEIRESGYRVAQVESETFEVGGEMFWIPCLDNIKADEFWYDPIDQLIKVFPIEVEDSPMV
jgi:hypothetical protein